MDQGFNFTIAVAPNDSFKLEREMRYMKTALLYADEITLISPVVHTFFELTNKKYVNNERKGLILLDKIASLIKLCDYSEYQHYSEVIEPMKDKINSKQYKHAPYYLKFQFMQTLITLSKNIDVKLREYLGNDSCNDIAYLMNNKIIKLETFESNLDDIDQYVFEYFSKLGNHLSNSYALFDEESNNLMSAAISDGIINMSKIAKYKTTQASLTENLFLKLPSFEFAQIDEILDIRKELEKSLIRFRSKTSEYSKNIQTLPWDKDFEDECYILYNKEIVPSILEIQEMIEDNNIIKNLGITILTDQSMLSSMGGLVAGVAATGAITSLNNAIASDKAMLAVGGAWAVSKVASAYNEYRKKAKEIERKDLYFYYKAGTTLIDEKYKMQ
ncbi:hypothetical protein [Tissierella sp.]|uniref:hypothetical protein n=1 Tax=Tissierella sp. TaxID=41274 RepID=UPI00285527D7|nr:hypothetical protein [Tissierella sp.]MDR7856109.1 hypothetical protein [Tissierella sp.]